MKSHRFLILGHNWRAYFLSPEAYQKKFGQDSRAIMDGERKTIHFDYTETSFETVLHELFHSYLAQLSFVELQLDEIQKEEFFCEMGSKYSIRIIKQGRSIYKLVLQHRRKR